MGYELYWLLPSETPIIDNGTTVIVESLNGTMYVDFIGPVFDGWGDDIVRWSYFPDENYASYQNALSDVKYYKEENEKLKKDVDEKIRQKDATIEMQKEWIKMLENTIRYYRNVYDDLDTEAKRDCIKDIIDNRDRSSVLPDVLKAIRINNSWSKYGDGDINHPSNDDLATENARSTREMSINDIRDAYIRACVKKTDREIERDLKPKIKREFLDE